MFCFACPLVVLGKKRRGKYKHPESSVIGARSMHDNVN